MFFSRDGQKKKPIKTRAKCRKKVLKKNYSLFSSIWRKSKKKIENSKIYHDSNRMVATVLKYKKFIEFSSINFLYIATL